MGNYNNKNLLRKFFLKNADIKIIIQSIIVFTSIFVWVYGIIAIFFLLIYRMPQVVTVRKGLILALPVLIIMLTFRKLEKFSYQIIDRFLLKKRLNYKEYLRKFADDILSIKSLKVLVTEIVDTFIDIFGVEKCGILVLDKEKDVFELIASRGLDIKKITFGRNSPIVNFLQHTKSPIVNKREILQLLSSNTAWKNIEKELKVELIIPLILHEEIIGILILGPKTSCKYYTQDDLDILLFVSKSMAIAIGNAQIMDNLSEAQAKTAQREKMAAIGTLAASINHKICNPLGIARGQCEVFLLNAQEGLYNNRAKEEQIYEARKIMEKVIKEIDRATAVSKRLALFAKPESGDMQEQVNISCEIDEVMALLGHELELENIKLVRDIPREIPSIDVNRKQFQEIFFNLIRGASQSINNGGRITIRAKEQENRVIIDIEDTGCGISEDRLDQIFSPFYTIDTSTFSKSMDTTLFIVRDAVEKNGGVISVRNNPDKGTTFRLEFLKSKCVV